MSCGVVLPWSLILIEPIPADLPGGAIPFMCWTLTMLLLVMMMMMIYLINSLILGENILGIAPHLRRPSFRNNLNRNWIEKSVPKAFRFLR